MYAYGDVHRSQETVQPRFVWPSLKTRGIKSATCTQPTHVFSTDSVYHLLTHRAEPTPLLPRDGDICLYYQEIYGICFLFFYFKCVFAACLPVLCILAITTMVLVSILTGQQIERGRREAGEKGQV